MTDYWTGYAQVERPTCCRWCPCCAVQFERDRKGSRYGYCNVLCVDVENLDAVEEGCPGNVVVEVTR